MTDVAGTLARELADRYAIEREIGRGGMATVYLAQDIRHDRRVAVKVLDPELGAVLGSERFLSEIRVTANLHHPHLLPLFDSGTVGGLLYYVMPYIEGESLRQRLDREKQLPIDDAVRITIGVASALGFAHARGIVHRDLKPENVLLQAGQPVVADFGIALALTAAGATRLTQTGLSLGTPQYMSPEQATGDRQIDARSDVYSLGAILYEMLTGEPPHSGPTVQAVIAKLLTETPRPVQVLRPGVSVGLQQVVEQALARLPADRIQSAERFVQLLQTSDTATKTVTARRGAPRAMPYLPWALLALSIALLLPGRFSARRSADPTLRAVIPIDLRTVTWNPVISPDGTRIAYIEKNGETTRLALYDLATGQSRTIDDSEFAAAPFFSPDGQWIAFFIRGRLLRTPASGGPIEPLADIHDGGGFRSGTWTSRNEIVFSSAGMWKVPASGGTVTRVGTEGDTIASRCVFPMATPDGRRIACSRGGPLGVEDDFLTFVELETGRGTVTSIPMRNPVGFFDGDFLFRQTESGLVMAAPFDERRGTISGALVQLYGASRHFSVSDNGTALAIEDSRLSRVVLRAGDSSRTLWSPPWPVKSPRFSPDGRSVAVVRWQNAVREIWTYDLTTGTPNRISAFGDAVEWTPDGQRLVFLSPSPGMQSTRELHWRRADLGSSEESLFHTDSGSIMSAHVAPDGKQMMLWMDRPSSLWRVKLPATDAAHTTVASGEGRVDHPRYSPDGRWLAYVSDETGRPEVVMRRADGTGGRVTVSDDGGEEPVWDRKGQAIFYRKQDTFVRAALAFTPSPVVTGRTVVLTGVFGRSFDTGYDVAPDGQRLLVTELVSGGQVVIMTRWLDELKARKAR